MNNKNTYDVVVIGGGHAGCEAASASARMGSKTLLLTHSIDQIGQMSCNPAVGGLGKSQLVREIDACDGLMAKATDKAGIHYRILNKKKGAAVRATRVQTDRQLYKIAMRQLIDGIQNIDIFQQSVVDLDIVNNKVFGVFLELGVKVKAKTVILTTGTFLAGKIHVGSHKKSGGRATELSSDSLANSIRSIGLKTGRLKTGTPPRLDSRSINLEILEPQPGEKPIPRISFEKQKNIEIPQISCFLTRTTRLTKAIIEENLDKSPLYNGLIEGIGPRYCPSIEDKIVRFSEKDSHQVFLEPEGLSVNELYPNGISTSLPYNIQLDIVRSMEGCQNAIITRPGYAIEYDYLDPRDLKSSLESKSIEGLFLAGQINGTTGYEEAGAQGLLAGINAYLSVIEREPWEITRSSAYIGVLIDDLVTSGTDEPYRMFTSRAEYRLSLREDNADQRLTEKARKLGLVSEKRWREFCERQNSISLVTEELNKRKIKYDSEEFLRVNKYLLSRLKGDISILELFKRPEFSVDLAEKIFNNFLYERDILEQVQIETRYSGYIERQQNEIDKMTKQNQYSIPKDINFHLISGLSNEVKQKLCVHKPSTIAQAAMISGVTPAAVSLLFAYIKKTEKSLALSNTS